MAMKRFWVFSVGGYHPTTGQLSYANYQGFSSAATAQEWQSKQVGWDSRDIISHPVDAFPLATGLPCNTLVYWSTLGGDEKYGWLKEYDNGTAIIVIDGKEQAVRA